MPSTARNLGTLRPEESFVSRSKSRIAVSGLYELSSLSEKYVASGDLSGDIKGDEASSRAAARVVLSSVRATLRGLLAVGDFGSKRALLPFVDELVVVVVVVTVEGAASDLGEVVEASKEMEEEEERREEDVL